MSEVTCINDGVIFEAKRSTKQFCSDKCRVEYSRKQSAVEEERIAVVEPKAVVPFRFKTPDKRAASGFHEDENGVRVRTASVWTNVPLCAIPIVEKGDPAVPEWMNGRQYFLWRANEFKLSDENSPIPGIPEIINPYPANSKPVTFHPGGQASRQWGA